MSPACGFGGPVLVDCWEAERVAPYLTGPGPVPLLLAVVSRLLPLLLDVSPRVTDADRPVAEKPAETLLAPGSEPARVVVKFAAGTRVRLGENGLNAASVPTDFADAIRRVQSILDVFGARL